MYGSAGNGAGRTRNCAFYVVFLRSLFLSLSTVYNNQAEESSQGSAVQRSVYMYCASNEVHYDLRCTKGTAFARSRLRQNYNAFSQERRFTVVWPCFSLRCTALHCPPLRCMLLPLANIRRPHSGFAGTRLPQPCTWNIGVHCFLAFSCARSLDWLRRLIICFCMYYMVRDVQGPAVRKEAPHLSQDKSKEGLGELYEKEVRLCGSAVL